jgi:hypothetical protein
MWPLLQKEKFIKSFSGKPEEKKPSRRPRRKKMMLRRAVRLVRGMGWGVNWELV